MKIKLSPKGQELASSLLVVLVIGSVLSFSAMGYLSLTEQQNMLSYRSQAWNGAIAVTEAGLEEGLQQLNSNTSNLGGDGWSANGSVYTRTRTLPNGDSYTVTIDQTGDPSHPSITARSAVALPGTSSSGTVGRAVRVRCSRGNLLIKGMVAKHLIDMNGNNIQTDSFDSTDPSYSTVGRYDPTKTKANGDVATNEKIANGINVGNANIYGHVITGPGGSVAVGSQGGVGDQAWQAIHRGQIQPGYFANNANFTFPEQVLPYTSAAFPDSGTISVTNYMLGTNIITSSTYPNPLPYGGVRSNITYITTPTWPNVPSTTTNCSASTSKSKTPPAAGTFCGTPWQSGNWYYYYTIESYTYPSTTYTYTLYSTNYTVTTTYYDHILTSGDYYLSELSGKTLVLGNCRLVVPAGINMSGNDVLQIEQSGSLAIYVGGTSSTIGGNGVINKNGYAVNCRILCANSVTSLAFNGNGEFIGVIVAPSAYVQMNGGGSSDNDFIGALMADSIKMNGHYSFHYDEALSKMAADSRYIITSWDEIDPSGT
jgi:hypothetical protein